MAERPLVFIFVFTYLNRRISRNGLQNQMHLYIQCTLSKVDFSNPISFSLSFYSYSLVFVIFVISIVLQRYFDYVDILCLQMFLRQVKDFMVEYAALRF